ncbi:Endothelial cell-selective adhesion molecule, partial [Dryobates pubescens]
PTQILSYLDGMVKVEETELRPRVGFLYPVVTHNISVLINGSRERDSGRYMVTVNVADEAAGVGIIRLNVQEVGAGPVGPGQGGMVGKAKRELERGEKEKWLSLRLGRAWPRLPREVELPHGWQQGSSDHARGTLKLTNLSLEMSGVYLCVAENRAGSANCSIALEV